MGTLVILSAIFYIFLCMAKLDEQALSSLFCLARKGDQQAYKKFLHALLPTLRGMVVAMVFSIHSEDREDIVQDILFAVHQKGHTWQKDKPLLPWIYAIARHKIIDFGRSKTRQWHDVALEQVSQMDLEITDPEPPENIAKHIQKLDSKSAKIVHALVVEDKTITTISHDFGMSENAVRIVFHRSLKKLRTYLKHKDVKKI